MIDDSESSAKHFRSLSEIDARLASKRIAIYEHSFHYLAFGSWDLVAGTREKMMRFSYEGKESYMKYGDASVVARDYSDLEHRSFHTWEGEDPFEFAADVLEAMFSHEG